MPEKQAKYVAFDIEIAAAIPKDAADWKAYRPFGISCAATITTDGEARCWYKRSVDGKFSDQMDKTELRQLIQYLAKLQKKDYTIVTWNGLGFDFDVLAEESEMVEECKQMALDHIDIMFQFFCIKGFPLGLDKAAKGMGLEGKTGGMDGSMAPTFWKEGRHREVLEYMSQDVGTILQLALLIQKRHRITWISNTGNPQQASFPNGLSPVLDSKELPDPDTSWMSNPWPRSKFYGWALTD